MSCCSKNKCGKSPYVFELNTFSLEDTKSNCTKMTDALEKMKTSLVKLENSLDNLLDDLDSKTFDQNWSLYKALVNNFMNELTSNANTQLAGVFTKSAIRLYINRAASDSNGGKIWLHEVYDSKYGFNSYEVDTTNGVDLSLTLDVTSTSASGSATVTDSSSSSPFSGSNVGDVIKLSNTSNSVLDNNYYRIVSKTDANNVVINLGNTTHGAINVTGTGDVTNYSAGTIATNFASSKQVATKVDNTTSHVGFYMQGWTLYFDEFQCIDIQIAEKTASLDLNTASNPAEESVSTYRILPRRLINDVSDNADEAIPTTNPELRVYLQEALTLNASGQSTYNDSDDKNCKQERTNLSNKIDLAISNINDFCLSPYLNMN